ncbi:MAG: dethiobiotin synthase [Phycisphaeraceae bacterium]
MFSPPPLAKPGLFITATDTGVGKTVATCAIAWQLRQQGLSRVGVCKPMSSGCRRDREGLVSEDAEALAHFADCRQPLSVINPIRYARPLAPAVAADLADEPPDFAALTRSLELLEATQDCVLFEGVGGLLVPLHPKRPQWTVLDLAVALNYPVVVVCRAGLGTLNHTAMTVRLLREAGCTIAGLIINGYIPDPGEAMATAVKQSARSDEPSRASKSDVESARLPVSQTLQSDPRDDSMSTNRIWLQKMNHVPILATIPTCPSAGVAPEKGRIPDAILDAVGLTYWPDVLAPPVK